MSCEKCLYNKNCQFLAKTKAKKIVGCTAFTTLEEHDKALVEKVAQRLKEKMRKGKALHTPIVGKEYIQRIIREVVDEICKEITEGK